MTGRRTVLVVDDDPGILHVLSSGLSRVLEGYDIMTASNGREAIDLMAERPPSVLVTDLAMPVMDGFALISHVTHHHPALPVVVLTGLAPANTDPELASFGSLRVLRKPASYQTVAQAVLAEVEGLERGETEGIALAGVLQLVESERRNCTVVVRSGKRRGHLHFESGRLVNAFSDDFGAEGEAAAFDILGWPDTAIELEPLPHHVRHLVQTPLQRLLADVAAVTASEVAEAPAFATGTASYAPDPAGATEPPDPSEVELADTEPDAIEIPTADAEPDAVDPPLTETEAIELTFGVPEVSSTPPGEAEALDPPPGAPDADAVVTATAVAPSAGVSAPAGGGTSAGVTAAIGDDHVAAMVAAIERLSHRAREADEALAAVATEVEAFREARRRFDEVNERREHRRRELEALRVDVGHLAREILGRVDSLFDSMNTDPSTSDQAQELPPS